MTEIRDTDFKAFCDAAMALVREQADLTAPDFAVEVGFPSRAFPIAPERLDAAATMTAINHEFITFSALLRKTAQTKLLMHGQPLQWLTRVVIEPGDVVDAGDGYLFRLGGE